MEEVVVATVPGSGEERPVRLAWQTPEMREGAVYDLTHGGLRGGDPDAYPPDYNN